MEDKKIFFPDLDGWRFIAFLAVFYHHSFSTQFDYIKENSTYKFVKGTTVGGDLGVDFFFVLSGFLIIYLLIAEKETTNRINVKNFYIRRILRIFPLYYFCVFFGFIVFPFLKTLSGVTPDENAHPLFYWFFLGNIDIVNQGILPDSGTLGILWSVAIEEQFYLTIPFLLLIAPIRFYKWIFFGVIITSWMLRSQHLDDDIFLKYHTFASMGNLAIGGIIAYYSATNKRFLNYFENLNPYIIKGVYLSVILIFLFRWQIFAYPVSRIFDTSIIAGLFALIILEQNFSKQSFFKMKNNRLFSNLGKYTYGLYCLHLLAAVIILQITAKLRINTELWQVFFIETPLMLATSIILAYLSYQYYEKPFLKLKNKFSILQTTEKSD